MNLLNHITLEFSDKKMETEYNTIKKNNLVKDFIVTFLPIKFLIYKAILIFMLLINLMPALEGYVKGEIWNIALSSSIFGIIIITFCIGSLYKRAIQYLTLFLLFAFIIGRLIVVKYR